MMPSALVSSLFFILLLSFQVASASKSKRKGKGPRILSPTASLEAEIKKDAQNLWKKCDEVNKLMSGLEKNKQAFKSTAAALMNIMGQQKFKKSKNVGEQQKEKIVKIQNSIQTDFLATPALEAYELVDKIKKNYHELEKLTKEAASKDSIGNIMNSLKDAKITEMEETWLNVNGSLSDFQDAQSKFDYSPFKMKPTEMFDSKTTIKKMDAGAKRDEYIGDLWDNLVRSAMVLEKSSRNSLSEGSQKRVENFLMAQAVMKDLETLKSFAKFMMSAGAGKLAIFKGLKAFLEECSDAAKQRQYLGLASNYPGVPLNLQFKATAIPQTPPQTVVPRTGSTQTVRQLSSAGTGNLGVGPGTQSAQTPLTPASPGTTGAQSNTGSTLFPRSPTSLTGQPSQSTRQQTLQPTGPSYRDILVGGGQGSPAPTITSTRRTDTPMINRNTELEFEDPQPHISPTGTQHGRNLSQTKPSLGGTGQPALYETDSYSYSDENESGSDEGSFDDSEYPDDFTTRGRVARKNNAGSGQKPNVAPRGTTLGGPGTRFGAPELTKVYPPGSHRTITSTLPPGSSTVGHSGGAGQRVTKTLKPTSRSATVRDARQFSMQVGSSTTRATTTTTTTGLTGGQRTARRNLPSGNVSIRMKTGPSMTKAALRELSMQSTAWRQQRHERKRLQREEEKKAAEGQADTTGEEQKEEQGDQHGNDSGSGEDEIASAAADKDKDIVPEGAVQGEVQPEVVLGEPEQPAEPEPEPEQPEPQTEPEPEPAQPSNTTSSDSDDWKPTALLVTSGLLMVLGLAGIGWAGFGAKPAPASLDDEELGLAA